MLKNFVMIAAILFIGASCAVSQGWSSGDDGAWEEGGDGWDNGNGWEDGDNGHSGGDWDNGGDQGGSGGWDESGGDRQNTDQGEGVYYSSQISEDSGTLIDESASGQYNQAQYMLMPGGSQNVFWIVSRDGSRNWRSIDMPLFRYARMLIIPSISGYMTLEEMYPGGRVRYYEFGYVQSNRPYRLWFYADTPGVHQGRYEVNGRYSDTLTFNVM